VDTAYNSALVTSHSMELTGLTANTTYTYTVESTDGSGNTGTAGPFTFTTLDEGGGGDAYMYVYSIDMALGARGRNILAYATVTIVDSDGNPVSGATVSGSWSGVVSGSASGITGTDGSVTLASPKTKTSGTFTFTVGDVTGTLPYWPSENNVDSGSIN